MCVDIFHHAGKTSKSNVLALAARPFSLRSLVGVRLWRRWPRALQEPCFQTAQRLALRITLRKTHRRRFQESHHLITSTPPTVATQWPLSDHSVATTVATQWPLHRCGVLWHSLRFTKCGPDSPNLRITKIFQNPTPVQWPLSGHCSGH